jgi:leucyl aminopeptidase
MNFQIEKLSLSAAIQGPLDALLVLWPSQVTPNALGHDPVTRWVATALEQGDFELKAGAVLSLYCQPGISQRHLVVVCTGDNQPAQIRSAVQSGWGALKSAKVKHLGLHVVGDASPQVLQSALSHLADDTYAYTTTLSQPKARVLKQVRVSAEKVTEAHASSVRHAQALIAGVELAKEWANRPANHATPSHLAQAAKGVATGRAFKCEVLGPKEVAKLGMGGLHGRGPGRG